MAPGLHSGGADYFLSGEDKTSSGALKSTNKVEEIQTRKRGRRLRKGQRERWHVSCSLGYVSVKMGIF